MDMDYRKIQRNLLLEGGFSFSNFTLVNGVFLVGFALALGANSIQIGLLASVPLLANLIQFVSAFILEATGTKKLTTIYSLLVARVVWIPVSLIALGILPVAESLAVFSVIFVVSNLFTALGNLSMLSWMKDLIRKKDLTSFFGRRNTYATLGGIAVYIFCSYYVDRAGSLAAFGHIFLLSFGLGILGLILLLRIPEKKGKIKAISFRRMKANMFEPFRDNRFRPFVLFGTMWGFMVNIMGPFFYVLLIQDFGLGFFLIALFITLDGIGRVYGLGLWAPFIRRFGAKPIIIVAATVNSFCPLFFLFLGGSNWFLGLPIVFIWAVSLAGLDLAVVTALIRTAPRKKDAYYFSAFSSMTGLASALGPVAGGLLVTLAVAMEFPSSLLITPVKYTFIATFIGRVLCLPLVYRIVEPKARSVNDVISRMRELRFISLFANFYSLANITSKLVLFPNKQIFLLQRKAAEMLRKDVLKHLRNLRRLSAILTRNAAHKLADAPEEFHRIGASLEKGVEDMGYAAGTLYREIPQKIATHMKKAYAPASGEREKFPDRKRIKGLGVRIMKGLKKMEEAYRRQLR